MSAEASPLHSFCMSCGYFAPADLPCPRCGTQPQPAGADGFELQFTLPIQTCAHCGAIMSYGTASCPSCGAACDRIEPTDAPINRAKAEALGDLLPRLRELVVENHEGATAVTLTDEQWLAYILRNDLMSERLIATCREVVVRLDLTSEASIHSGATRDAFEQLVAHAQEVRRVYDDLTAVALTDQFAGMQPLTLAVYRSVLDLCAAITDAVFATTIEGAAAAQAAMQSAINRAGAAAQAGAEAIRAADPSAMATSIAKRLTAFTGIAGTFEDKGQIDFGSVLALAQEARNAGTLNQIGAAYLGRALSEPTLAALNDAPALYLCAASVAASDDPLSLRRRVNTMLDVLEDAFRADPIHVAAVVAAAKHDIELGSLELLSIEDTARAMHTANLRRESKRQVMYQMYGTLTEAVFGRLINLLMNARFLLSGKGEPYAYTAERKLADKLHTLSQERDPRYAAAMLGISMVVRNAGAHGGVDLSGDKIRFRQVDRVGRETDVEMSDDEFTGRLSDLKLTCEALTVAYELFQLEHWDALPAPGYPTTPRIIEEHVRSLVGIRGLGQAKVDLPDNRELAIIEAVQVSGDAPKDPEDYTVLAAMLSRLVNGWRRLRLCVTAIDGTRCQLAVPTQEAAACLLLPEDEQYFGALKLSYLTEIQPGPATEAERYARTWIRGGSRLIAVRLGELGRAHEALAEDAQGYERKVREILRDLRQLSTMLAEVEPPAPYRREHEQFMWALKNLRKDLYAHKDLLVAGKVHGIRKHFGRIHRAGKAIVHLMRFGD